MCAGALLFLHRTSRGLHFWEVVPLEVLLEQLVGTGAAAPGSSSVAQKLHQLLVPSYFPNPQEGAVSTAAGRVLGRCCERFLQNHTALADMLAVFNSTCTCCMRSACG
jgi:hypothetical protein